MNHKSLESHNQTAFMVAPNEPIPHYVDQRVTQAIHASGYPLLVAASSDLIVDYWLHRAHREQPVHQVLVSANRMSFMDHFILIAATRILSDQQMPMQREAVVETRRLPDDPQQDLERKLAGAPVEFIDGISCLMHQIVTQQLASTPGDLMAERIVYDSLPGHRERQSEYARAQVNGIELLLDNRVKAMAPDAVYRASLAMNAVIAYELGDICGQQFSSVLASHVRSGKAEMLLESLHDRRSACDNSEAGVVEDWAQILGLEGWLRWRSLE